MKQLYKLLIALMILTFNTPLTAEDEIAPLPSISLPSDKLDAIRLDSLTIVTKITGNIAQTTYEMGFYNPNSRVLEGELKMPLLEGQSVVGYALEINGAFREAVVVNKAKAKESFENTIRQNIDPAIMEKTLGNNYKLRLYPIPSKGIKKLKVTVEELLSSKDGSYRYAVPFVSDDKIANFTLDLRVVSALKPRVKGFIENEEIQASTSGYFVEYKKKNIQLNSSIKLEIPKSKEGNDYFQTSNGSDNWFMSLVDKKPSKNIEKALPKNLEIIWDSSLTLFNRSLEKEFAFLEGIFTEIKNCNISLKRLDIEMHDEGSYKLVNGDWSRLKEKLQNIEYNGAKDLSKLKISQSADEILIFSNGVNTFSESILASTSKSIIAVNSSLVADHNNLKYISNNYINLLGLSDEDGVKKYLNNSSEEITQVSKNLSDIYIKDLDESYLILGRVDGKRGSLTFKSGDNDYVVNIESKKESKLLARVWAKEKIDELSLRYKNNKSQITQLSKEYTIMSKDSSLIVLDRVADYVQYEIVPPKELQEEYYKLLEQRQQKRYSQKDRAIEEAVQLLKSQMRWYKKDFLAIAEAKKNRVKKELNELLDSEETISYDSSSVSPVVVAPAPAPMIARERPMAKKSKSSVAKDDVVTSMPKEVEKQIKLKEWSPNAPYIKEIKAVASDKQMQKYYLLQGEYLKSIPFYLDMADFFHKKGQKKEALLILSNILELDFENSEYMRVFAFKLLELKFDKVAVWFFKKVEELRPFEAQASRDLALVYERVGRYQEALERNYHILSKSWDGRFSGSKIVTINEMNHLISMGKVDTSAIDKRLISDMPVGMRIVINWSTDNSDMDLWVIDPNNEKTYYAHRESTIGGKISNDMTRGYGPEEFMIRKAIRGKYQIKIKYFASSAQKVMGETVIRAEVYTDYASGKEKMREIVFRVKEAKNVIDIGEIVY